jgi:hypothetical protein
VAFTNDFVDPVDNNDRNLFVDRFSIEGPLPGSTDGSPTGRAEAITKLQTLFERVLLRAPVRGGAGDEIEPLYDVLADTEIFSGDRASGWSGACEALLGHPDFLFTRAGAFDAASGGERERLLTIKSAFDLIDRPPTDDELLRFNAGEARAALVDEWLGSPEFDRAYEQRIRAVLEFDGTPDGEEPARLWSYITRADRPLQEVLTADYTVGEAGAPVERPAEHGATGILTMKGYIVGKPGLPHYNYAARVLTGFLGFVFEVPQEALDARATATAASTVDPTSICFSCHRVLTPLAHQRQRWDDLGNYRTTFDDGRTIDDSDNDLVADYPFRGPGLESFSLVAVRKEGFIRKMVNTHFQMMFGRNLRHDLDERDVYLTLWNAADSGRGTFKSVLRTILASRSYTNPPAPQTGGDE